MRDYLEPIPWRHNQNRCYRTAKDLLRNKVVSRGILWHEPEVAHDALEDALAQAKNAQIILKLNKE